MAELVTQTTFSKRIGVSHAAIYRAVHAGRIDTVETQKGTRINWDTEFPKFVRTSLNPRVRKKFKNMKQYSPSQMKQDSKLVTANKKPKKKKGNGRGDEEKGDYDVFTLSIEEMDVGDVLELTAAIKAKKAQLEYEREMGSLIPLDKVMATNEEIAANVKSALLSIPDRICSEMEGMSSADMHKLLVGEIKHALIALAIGLRNE